MALAVADLKAISGYLLLTDMTAYADAMKELGVAQERSTWVVGRFSSYRDVRESGL
jgi:vacuolar-type H+-ATPase subunit B/Vma2